MTEQRFEPGQSRIASRLLLKDELLMKWWSDGVSRTKNSSKSPSRSEGYCRWDLFAATK